MNREDKVIYKIVPVFVFLAFLVFAIGFCTPTNAVTGVDWEVLTPGTDTGIKFGVYSVNSIAYGGGKFVAVGIFSTASYSTNGINWTVLPAGADSGIKLGSGNAQAVAYGGGKFVVAGGAGGASYSTNGIDWTSLPAGVDTGIKFGTTAATSVTYGDGKFVVVGSTGKASYSTNGIDWTSLPAGVDTGIKFGNSTIAWSVTYGVDKFLAVGNSGMSSYSTNGIDWTSLPAGVDTGIKFGTISATSVAYGGGKFIVAGGSGMSSYSTDGIDWTSLPAGVDTGIKFGTTNALAVVYGSNRFVVGGVNGMASYSPGNAVPVFSGITIAPNLVKGGNQITVSVVGQGDGDTENLQLFCNETGAPTAADNLCDEGSASYSSPYDSMVCTYNAPPGHETRTTYCRIFDGIEYSSAKTGVYTTDSLAPSVPVASPVGGSFTSIQSVSLSAEVGAIIYYTVNGANPTTSSTVYSDSINIPSTMNLKAIAVDAVGNVSGIITEIYTINIPIGSSSSGPSSSAKPLNKKIKAEGAINNTKTRQKIIMFNKGGNFRIFTKISDPDQLKKAVISVGGKTFVLKNTRQKDMGTYSTILSGFKNKTGDFPYTLIADYGYTQVREKGIVSIKEKKKNVPMSDVNKNFRETFGRNPTRHEWNKWAKQVVLGITKDDLKVEMLAGK